MNEGVRGISRRRFLQGISGMVGGLGLAACEIVAYPPATPTPVERVTVVPVPTRRPYVVPVEVELTIGSFAGPEMKVFRELLRRFHSYYPGIRIRLDVAKVESQRAWLLLLHAAGHGIDVAQVVGPHLEFVEERVFSKLHGFVKADKTFGIEAYYSRIVDYYSTPDDGIWCLPWSYSTEALYYNKQHFAEAGISIPNVNWTWDDVRDAARKLTKDADNDHEPESWGTEFRLHNLDYVLRSFGGGFPIGEPENPEEIRAGNSAALQFAADLVQDEDVHPYPRLGWKDGFARGKVSMSFLPEWATARLNKVEGLEYDVAPIPQGSEGSVTSFASSGVAMGTWCDFPDHAWEVVKWFAHADYGEWAVAQAFLFPEGLPTALRAANEYCWTSYHDRPENRRLFLQNFETAMVPFSDSSWWPYLSEYRWHQNQSNWPTIRRVIEGRASVEEVVKELEESWDNDKTEMAKVLSREYTGRWSCS